MQDILRDELNLFYSQFTMNLCERKRLIQRSYISPPRALINHILEKVESFCYSIFVEGIVNINQFYFSDVIRRNARRVRFEDHAFNPACRYQTQGLFEHCIQCEEKQNF